MPMTPRVFSNRYELQRELAKGGMADVYLARDQLLDRPIALKVLFAEFARDPSFVERFRREAQAAANLNHPNIVGIYDWGQEGGTYFIVMEYVEGRSLREVVRSQGRLPATQVAEIGAEIASALEFAHRNGVVHRDVKPGNVLITATGQVKVTDFGIARAGTGEALTQTGAVMGTATYFSPEQAQGLPVDGRSDVYSLGVVLYEMATGVPPFSGESPVAVAYKHVREQPTPPSQRVDDIPPDLERIIQRAMAKHVEDRYQSAEELRDDLLRFHRGRPLAPAPVTAMVTEVPTAATAATTMAMTRAGPPGPAPSKRRWGPILAVGSLLALIAAVIVALLAGAFSSDSTPTVGVPDVVGQNVVTATRTLEGRGFKVDAARVTNDSAPADQVVKQDPGAGSRSKKGGTVHLQVSGGPGKVTVPSLKGEQADDARRLLEERGLVVVGRFEESDTVDAGTVIRTSPGPGKKVARGSKVTVFVASPAQVEVPDVTNRDELTAVSILGQHGLDRDPNTITEASDQFAQGRVIRTDPPAGDKVAKGTTVQLVVSSGPDSSAIPNVKGLSEADARAQLSAAGFTNITRVFDTSSAANDGLVVDQEPAAGTTYSKKATVTLHIGQSSSTSSTSGTTTTTSSSTSST